MNTPFRLGLLGAFAFLVVGCGPDTVVTPQVGNTDYSLSNLKPGYVRVLEVEHTDWVKGPNMVAITYAYRDQEGELHFSDTIAASTSGLAQAAINATGNVLAAEFFDATEVNVGGASADSAAEVQPSNGN